MTEIPDNNMTGQKIKEEKKQRKWKNHKSRKEMGFNFQFVFLQTYYYLIYLAFEYFFFLSILEVVQDLIVSQRFSYFPILNSQIRVIRTIR